MESVWNKDLPFLFCSVLPPDTCFPAHRQATVPDAGPARRRYCFVCIFVPLLFPAIDQGFIYHTCMNTVISGSEPSPLKAKKVHLIAIGGSIMHSLAIALHLKGLQVTGSDDEIFEPSRSDLARHGLLPGYTGWNPGMITPDLDAVILGMHAHEDNLELIRARELGIRIYSFPEYFYEQTRDKKRIVIAGSHGKTTITAMVMHALRSHGFPFDYLIGSHAPGFEHQLSLADDTNLAVIEGDEYLSSPVDRRPKFHLYHPHVALINGIAWDHINVFPTFGEYVKQFELFIAGIEHGGMLAYYAEDPEIQHILHAARPDIHLVPYKALPYHIDRGITFLDTEGTPVPLQVFGRHNLQNMAGAMAVCQEAGMAPADFIRAMSTFKGADRRLQILRNEPEFSFFFDFAHAPSKLKATIEAVKEQYPDRFLVACMELHTFSSLTKAFLEQYQHTMEKADLPVVFFNPDALAHKKLPSLAPRDILNAFGNNKLEVYSRPEELTTRLLTLPWKGKNLLMMSSGNFAGINMTDFSQKLNL